MTTGRLAWIPAFAGMTTGRLAWIPAFAGMTTGRLAWIPAFAGMATGRLDWIPAFAGMAVPRFYSVISVPSVAKNPYELNSLTSALMDCLASPNSIRVFSPKNSGLSTPAKPAAMERFSTNTVLA